MKLRSNISYFYKIIGVIMSSISPISNSHKIHQVRTEQSQNLSEISKTNSLFGTLLTNLPTRATVQSQLSSKPSKFNENFSNLIKNSGVNLKQELTPQSSIIAPFILLGKLGSSIIGKFKSVLESLNSTSKTSSELEIDKLVSQAKKNTPKTKTSKKNAL